jgi:predicted CoA-substrate-specific enzyme activase
MSESNGYFAGIDVGSTTTKAVIVDAGGELRAAAVARSGADFEGAAWRTLEEALGIAGILRSRIGRIVSTGYGRRNVAFADDRRTEIACHARGAFEQARRAVTVVDVGGQDSKLIVLDDAGARLRFRMNRKCAAGTGAFLEEMARRLDVPVGELDLLARHSTKKVSLGSFCTVFAATEVLAKIRAGEKREDLAHAALRSVARQATEGESVTGPVIATGGVAEHLPLFASILADLLQTTVEVPAHAQACGAFGAALVARDGSGADEPDPR